MTDEPQARKSGLSWTVYAIAAGSLSLVLYILSTGPFAWLVTHGYLSQTQCEFANNTIYAPITWSVTHSRTVYSVVEVWVSWWSASP